MLLRTYECQAYGESRLLLVANPELVLIRRGGKKFSLDKDCRLQKLSKRTLFANHVTLNICIAHIIITESEGHMYLHNHSAACSCTIAMMFFKYCTSQNKDCFNIIQLMIHVMKGTSDRTVPAKAVLTTNHPPHPII